MRVMLAKLLLEKPDLLMLDEPTNHLDLPSIRWVEQYLRSYEGAVLVVSHDRRFLDQVCLTMVEVAQQSLIVYPGNYSNYLDEKALRSEIHNNAFQNQQQKIKQSEQFINRFRAKSTKARQVQSRIKSLERMDKIEEISDTVAPVNFRFDFSQKSGRFVSTLKDVSKSYGSLEIFQQASALIERGDKIALIGANGKGKSTLLRIISGNESIGGESQLGYNVNMAFYAQHQLESLNVDNEILEELKQAGSGKSDLELRGVLGCFLFREEDVFKKIKVLSGGEKSRVALAKTMISEANFLLLDEPTNHLDMQSVQILIQALNQYKGSFLIVSHDRHFISKVANKIWYIQGKELKSYPGNYQEYEYWRSQQAPTKTLEKTGAKPKVQKKKKPTIQSPSEPLKELQKSLTTIENQITSCEALKNELEVKLSDPKVFSDPSLLEETTEAFQKNQEKLNHLNEQWETLATKIDGISTEK